MHFRQFFRFNAAAFQIPEAKHTYPVSFLLGFVICRAGDRPTAPEFSGEATSLEPLDLLPISGL